MNKDAYARLPPKAKAALDKNSGYLASQSLGGALDKIYAESEQEVRRMSGHVIAQLPEEDRERINKQIGATVLNDWVKSVPNGAAILSAYRAEAEKVRQGH